MTPESNGGYMPSTQAPAELAYVAELSARWRSALRLREQGDSEALDAAEQRAYDALVDYIEGNGLNHSEWDPRP